MILLKKVNDFCKVLTLTHDEFECKFTICATTSLRNNPLTLFGEYILKRIQKQHPGLRIFFDYKKIDQASREEKKKLERIYNIMNESKWFKKRPSEISAFYNHLLSDPTIFAAKKPKPKKKL